MFQVEPNTKLFPAVFCLPSSQNMLQVELGKLKVWYTNIYVYIKTNQIRRLEPLVITEFCFGLVLVLNLGTILNAPLLCNRVPLENKLRLIDQ